MLIFELEEYSGRYLRLLGVCFLMLTTSWSSAFDYTNFSSTAGLNLVGGATQVTNFVRLTPASSLVLGAAWYAQKQSCASGFSTASGSGLPTRAVSAERLPAETALPSASRMQAPTPRLARPVLSRIVSA